jgi:Tfp pilus assembly protein PilN
MANGDSHILETLKARLPKSASAVLSALFFIATVLVNYGASRTHISDVQAQQEKRLDNIEAQIRNDLATRREVDEVKSTVDRIEDKLDSLGDRLPAAAGPRQGTGHRSQQITPTPLNHRGH